ncbi:unnamed protein product [Nippostrongylus brasiliensis]|uniref:EF-hand domain-containing protein n=1 Tax=Nippostrongylus brasiliensis TaxID=27835 RepID=A0A0N4YX28_NIPBR|nr:unnamed protein product [Nippostrongylus brasiliensis]
MWTSHSQAPQKLGETAGDLNRIVHDFDEDFDMALNQDEVERVLAERFLVKPRENFPRLFYDFDHDHSGGLDLTEYMKFDASFPFDQTDPIVSELTAEHDKPSGQRVTSNRGAASRQGPQAPPKAAALPIFNSVHQAQQGNNGPSVFSPTVQLHPVEPGPTRPALPIVKLAKASKSI